MNAPAIRAYRIRDALESCVEGLHPVTNRQ